MLGGETRLGGPLPAHLVPRNSGGRRCVGSSVSHRRLPAMQAEPRPSGKRRADSWVASACFKACPWLTYTSPRSRRGGPWPRPPVRSRKPGRSWRARTGPRGRRNYYPTSAVVRRGGPGVAVSVIDRTVTFGRGATPTQSSRESQGPTGTGASRNPTTITRTSSVKDRAEPHTPVCAWADSNCRHPL